MPALPLLVAVPCFESKTGVPWCWPKLPGGDERGAGRRRHDGIPFPAGGRNRSQSSVPPFCSVWHKDRVSGGSGPHVGRRYALEARKPWCRQLGRLTAAVVRPIARNARHRRIGSAIVSPGCWSFRGSSTVTARLSQSRPGGAGRLPSQMEAIRVVAFPAGAQLYSVTSTE